MQCEGVRVVVNCFTYTSVYDKLVDHGICSPALFSIFAGFCCALSFIFCINTRKNIFQMFSHHILFVV